jgi:hypothetical protein
MLLDTNEQLKDKMKDLQFKFNSKNTEPLYTSIFKPDNRINTQTSMSIGDNTNDLISSQQGNYKFLTASQVSNIDNI